MTRDERILSALPIIRQVVAGYRIRGELVEEYEAQASLFLVEIAERFDPAENHRGEDGWKGYAAQNLRWAIDDWLRSKVLRSRFKTKVPVADVELLALSHDKSAAESWEEADANDLRPCRQCSELRHKDRDYYQLKKGRDSWCKYCRLLHRRARNTFKKKPSTWEGAKRRRPKYPNGKPARYLLMDCLRAAKRRLTKATDPVAIAKITKTIEGYEAEIRRIDGPAPTKDEIRIALRRLWASQFRYRTETNQKAKRGIWTLMVDQAKAVRDLKQRAKKHGVPFPRSRDTSSILAANKKRRCAAEVEAK